MLAMSIRWMIIMMVTGFAGWRTSAAVFCHSRGTLFAWTSTINYCHLPRGRQTENSFTRFIQVDPKAKARSSSLLGFETSLVSSILHRLGAPIASVVQWRMNIMPSPLPATKCSVRFACMHLFSSYDNLQSRNVAHFPHRTTTTINTKQHFSSACMVVCLSVVLNRHSWPSLLIHLANSLLPSPRVRLFGWVGLTRLPTYKFTPKWWSSYWNACTASSVQCLEPKVQSDQSELRRSIVVQ